MLFGNFSLMFDTEIQFVLIFEDSIIDSLINNDCIGLMGKFVNFNGSVV